MRVQVIEHYRFELNAGATGRTSVKLVLKCGHIKWQRGSKPIPKAARCERCSTLNTCPQAAAHAAPSTSTPSRIGNIAWSSIS